MARYLLLLGMLASLTGCFPKQQCEFDPRICYQVQYQEVHQLPRPFDPLDSGELETDWGKELKVARSFARDMDFYRAITFYKRALILMPELEEQRRHEAQYSIMLSYYMGQHYCEALAAFNASDLDKVTAYNFPAFEDMLIILEDVYHRLEDEERADKVWQILHRADPDTADDLRLSHALEHGCMEEARELARPERQVAVNELLDCYCEDALNPTKARFLNAVVPGAGYYYVGQPQSAITSFLLNAAFIAATVHFIDDGNWGAAAVTASLEAGWYVGGIQGAGLAAVEYNECIYRQRVSNFMVGHQLFPVLTLGFSF